MIFLLKKVVCYMERKNLVDERSLFTNRDTTVYKWKTDFQKYRGKDKNGEYLYDNIDDPFSDHAIIEAGIHLPPAY